MRDICDDLTAEHEALDAVVAPLAEDGWRTATPADGWTVADGVSHLWFFDGTATLAATDPAAFDESKRALLALTGGGADPSIEPGRAIPGAELLPRWRHDRRRLVEVLRGLDPSQRVPWYGPAMGARSFATARLMETWAHGQDIVDALGATRPATARLKHIAHIGVRARPFSYAINGRTMPDADVRVELRAPDGDVWTWGDAASTDRIEGDALQFCLLVTQRRHRHDTALRITGAGADEWAGFAQAFAGAPGAGREPGRFP